MPNKKEKKDAIKNTSRTKKIPMLKLDNKKKYHQKLYTPKIIVNILELMT